MEILYGFESLANPNSVVVIRVDAESSNFLIVSSVAPFGSSANAKSTTASSSVANRILPSFCVQIPILL